MPNIVDGVLCFTYGNTQIGGVPRLQTRVPELVKNAVIRGLTLVHPKN